VEVLLVMLGAELGPGLLICPGEFLREAFPLCLGVVEFPLKFTTGLVQAEQFVDVDIYALDPYRGLDRVRVLPDESSVQHGDLVVLAASLSAIEKLPVVAASALSRGAGRPERHTADDTLKPCW
jgi:hypothetical protein